MKERILITKQEPPTFIFEVDCDDSGNGSPFTEEGLCEMDKMVLLFANKRIKVTVEVIGEATENEA